MKIHGINDLSTINIKNISDILSKMKVGDKISVEVLSNNQNELSLKLPNGKIISAIATLPMDLFIGDFLDLSLKSKSDNQIVFETSKNILNIQENPKSEQISNSLISLKISPDERNLEIGKKLMENNLAINKENFKNVAELVSKFNNIDIEKATFVLGNNFEVNDPNIENLNKFISNKNIVYDSVEKLINTLSQEENSKVIEKIANTFDNLKLLQTIQEGVQEIDTLIKNFNSSKKNNIEELSESLVKQFVKIELQENIEKTININKKEISNEGKNVEIKKDINTSRNVLSISESDINNDISNNIKNKTIDELILKIPNKEINILLEQSPEIKQLISDIIIKKDVIEKIITDINGNLVNIGHEKGDKNNLNIITKIFGAFGLVKNEGLKSKINGNKLFNDLNLKLDILEQNINSFENKAIIGEGIKEIKNELGFMKNIDNTFYYIQMPVILNNDVASMELYVAKNNKNSNKIDAKNSTLYLSLNTKNLGTVEILTKILYSKISMDFKVENNKVIELIKINEDMLDELLSSKGYELNKINYEIIKKGKNLLEVADIMKSGEKNDKRLDIKV